MYLDYFGLERDPFTISPDPAFLYPSPQHRQALAHLKYGLDREGGFILLTGEVGTGKTTLTRLLLEQLPGNIRVAYILNAKLNSEDVLASICQELGLKYTPGCSIKSLTDIIYKDLLAAHSQGKKTLLVIEEAQNLDPDVLETLRLLTNLETNTTKLLHILLVGQPELLDLLARNDLRQLNQRVVSRFHIEPLDLQETGNYLAHRLRRAGCKKNVFDGAAVKQMHKLSDGIPRMLNLLAERALLGGYATTATSITAQIVSTASHEVLGKTQSSSNERKTASSRWLPVAIAIAALLITFGVFFFKAEKVDLIPEEASAVIPVVEQAFVEESYVEPLPKREPVDSKTALVSAAVETIDVPAALAAPVSEQPAAVTRNSYEQLLNLWSIDEVVSNQTNLCQIAKDNGLACQVDKDLDIKDLSDTNRPGLISLPGDEDSKYLYMLSDLDSSEVILVNSSRSISMPLTEFEQQWDGGLVYIWKPPVGYTGLLYPGVKNTEMVSWVQQQLEAVFDDYEYIIGGGIYSEPIASSVAKFQAEQGLTADGLLGPRTIMRFMDQNEDLPRLDQTRNDPSLVEEI